MISAHYTIQFNHLPALIAKVPGRTTRLVKTTLLNIENGSKGRVPVDTGALRRSIVTKMLSAFSGEVGPSLIYARRIELGFNGPDALGRVYHQAGRPYMRPAAEAEEPKFLRSCQELFEL